MLGNDHDPTWLATLNALGKLLRGEEIAYMLAAWLATLPSSPGQHVPRTQDEYAIAEQLFHLGMLTQYGIPTPLGNQMVELWLVTDVPHPSEQQTP